MATTIAAIAIASAATFGLGVLTGSGGSDRGATIQTVRQEGDPNDPEAMMKAWMEANQVGQQHNEMRAFVGQWDVTTTYHMPGMEGQTGTGSATFAAIMDGRFVRQEFTGQAMGTEMRGMSIAGYNTMANRYESVWVDSMSNPISFMTGRRDGDHLIYTGQETDPMTGKTREVRGVIRHMGKDHFTYTMQAPGQGGGWEDQMVIDYTRKGAGNGMGGGNARPGARGDGRIPMIDTFGTFGPNF